VGDAQEYGFVEGFCDELDADRQGEWVIGELGGDGDGRESGEAWGDGVLIFELEGHGVVEFFTETEGGAGGDG
jgi:hypothetical protein